MGDRYVKPDENKKLNLMDAIALFGHSMSQKLPFDGIEMWHGHLDLFMNWLEGILGTPNYSDNVYSVEVDLKYPEKIKEKTKKFPFCPENEIVLKKYLLII